MVSQSLADSLSELTVLAASAIDASPVICLLVSNLLTSHTQTNPLDGKLPSLRYRLAAIFTHIQTLTPVQLLTDTRYCLIDAGVNLILHCSIP